jgi:two-component system NtrC family sensor kinase
MPKRAGVKLYAQLTRKMAIVTIMVALVPLNLVGMAIFYHATNRYETRIKEELGSVAADRVNAVQLFIDERTSLLEMLVNTESLKDLLTSGRVHQIFNLLNRRSRTFLDLGLIDKEGHHLAYVGPYALTHQNYKDTYWFQQTMIRGVYISDVFLGLRGVPHVIVAVKKEEGERSWILRATIDSDVFNNLVRQAQVGASGDAFIVNSEGYYQTPSRFSGSVMDSYELDLKSIPPGISVVLRDTPRGQILTALAWLSKEKENWVLIIEEAVDESLGALAMDRYIKVGILGLGNLIVVLTVIFLLQLFVRQLKNIDRRRIALDAQLMHSARLASLGRMAAGVAHEINNPLAAIGELAGLMEDLLDDHFIQSTPNGVNFRKNIAKIQNQVERIRVVTHRFLGFARRMEPRQDLVDLGEML